MRNLKLLLLSCFALGSLYSQNPKLDSLKKLLTVAPPDTQRVNILNRVGYEYTYIGSYKQAINYFNEANELAGELNFEKGLASSYNGKGVVCRNEGNMRGALRNYFIALNLAGKMDNIGMTGSFSANIARVYTGLGDYSKALLFFNRAVWCHRTTGDKSKTANSYRGMGKIYLIQKDQKARYFFTEALKLYREADIPDGIAGALNDLGKFYADYNNITRALDYYNQSLKVSETATYTTEKANSYNSIGKLYLLKQEFNLAEGSFMKALEFYMGMNNYEEVSEVYFNLGELFYQAGELSKALKSYQSSLEFALTSGVLQKQKNAYSGLSKVYEKLNNPSEAFKNYKEHTKINQWIVNDEKTRQQLKSEIEFEYRIKENEMLFEQEKNRTKLKHEKIQRYFLIVCLILVTILTILIVQRLSLRQKLKVSGLRNKIAIDLHDEVGSALSSISMFAGISEMTEDEKTNKELIKKIASTSRETIENMSDIVWSLHPKNDNLNHVLEKMKNFGQQLTGVHGIEFVFEVTAPVFQTSLNMEERKNLYLIYKEAINNAVKYSGAKKICVSIEKLRSLIHLTVNDNGHGISPGSIPGNGLANMKQRASDIGGSLDIDSSEQGTTIQLKFRHLK